MDKKISKDNIEYTIVMDPDFPLGEMKETPESRESAAEPKKSAGNSMDMLYAEYERMCLKEPTLLDRDDAYPHSYQWRIIDRYDPAKIALVKKAIEEEKKIAELEEYQEFLEDISKRKLETNAWE